MCEVLKVSRSGYYAWSTRQPSRRQKANEELLERIRKVHSQSRGFYVTDPLFQSYQARGLNSQADAIISKEARDADPLTCSGETFTNSGTLESWVTLN